MGGDEEVAEIIWKPLEEGRPMPPSSFMIAKPALEDFLRQTVEEFAREGVYLNRSAQSAEMAAISYHLEDMRKLVFESKGKNQ